MSSKQWKNFLMKGKKRASLSKRCYFINEAMRRLRQKIIQFVIVIQFNIKDYTMKNDDLISDTYLNY